MSTKLALVALQNIQDDLAQLKCEPTPEVIKTLNNAICEIAEILANEIETSGQTARNLSQHLNE